MEIIIKLKDKEIKLTQEEFYEICELFKNLKPRIEINMKDKVDTIRWIPERTYEQPYQIPFPYSPYIIWC